MRSILSSLMILLSSSLVLAQSAPAALLLVSLPGRVEAASQQGIPPDYVLVSGAEDPTKIPSYLAWQHVRIVMECRQSALDASDDLQSSLSGPGWVVLSEWVRGRRSGIEAFVPKSDMEYFAKPR